MLFNCIYIVRTSLSLSATLHIILKKVDEVPGVAVFSGTVESDKGAPGNTSNTSASLYIVTHKQVGYRVN